MSTRFSSFFAGFKMFWELIRTTFLPLDWEIVGFISAVMFSAIMAVLIFIGIGLAIHLFR